VAVRVKAAELCSNKPIVAETVLMLANVTVVLLVLSTRLLVDATTLKAAITPVNCVICVVCVAVAVNEAVADLNTAIAVVCVVVLVAAINAKNPATGAAVTLKIPYAALYSKASPVNAGAATISETPTPRSV
jgi:hypothetical protein